jgi:hypothetical protein
VGVICRRSGHTMQSSFVSLHVTVCTSVGVISRRGGHTTFVTSSGDGSSSSSATHLPPRVPSCRWLLRMRHTATATPTLITGAAARSCLACEPLAISQSKRLWWRSCSKECEQAQTSPPPAVMAHARLSPLGRLQQRCDRACSRSIGT